MGIRRDTERDTPLVSALNMFRIPCGSARVLIVSLIATLWMMLSIAGVDGVEIKMLSIPPKVKSGSEEPILLDCDYTYDEIDKVGLVVKWYWNGRNHMVYQWIVGQPPQGLGILKDRLDLGHRVSSDNYTEFRALRIVRPTHNLTGEFLCQVSSYEDEKEKGQKLLVYSPASKINLKQEKPTDDSVNISCKATNLFPEPKAELLMIKGRKQKKEPVVNATINITPNDDGLFDVHLHSVFQDKALSAEITFKCIISVPEANWTEHEILSYYPGRRTSSPTSTVSSSLGKKTTTSSPPTITTTAITTTIAEAAGPAGSQEKLTPVLAPILFLCYLTVWLV